MKRVLFSFSFFCVYLLMPGQGPKNRMIDSIKTVLRGSGADTTRVVLLSQLAWLHTSVDLSVAALYADTLATELSRIKSDKRYSGLPKIEITEAEMYNTRGTISYYKGDLKPAIGFYLRGLRIFDKYGVKDKVAGMYNNIGSIYNTLKDYKDGLKYFMLSKSIKEELLRNDPDSKNLKMLAAKTYNNIGSVYGELYRYDSAIVYFDRSLKLKTESGDKRGAANTRNNIGEVFSAAKDYKKAEEYFKEALKDYEELGDPQGICLCLNSLGINCARLREYEKGQTYLKQAEEISLANDFKGELKANYYQQAANYQYLGNLKMALDYLRKYCTLNDTLTSRSVAEQSMEMASKYESEKKEQENKLLSAKNNLSAETIKRQKITGYFITAGLLLSLVLLVSIFRGLRNQKKANAIIAAQKLETEKQKQLADQKNKEITDSIVYASRIQKAMLTADNYIKKHLDDFFILFKPKDIVSGDFYWSLAADGKLYFVTADCTGHGVPGAMMSMLGINLLNEIIGERNVTRPDLVLNHLRRDIIKALNAEGADVSSNDGMDCTLLVIDREKLQLEYAGANNGFYILRKNTLLECKGDKMPVGRSPKEEEPFSYNRVELHRGDLVVTLTDGFADQFGGAYGKKFKYKQFEELILANWDRPAKEIKVILENALITWKGNLEQIDDICVIGIRI